MLKSSEQVHRGSLLLPVVLAVLVGLSHAQDSIATHTMQATVVGGTPGEAMDDLVTWTIDVPRPIPDLVEVEVEVRIVSYVETCVAEPESCIPAEAIAVRSSSCDDEVDNDGDGLVDLADHDCQNVSSWSFAIATDPAFGAQGGSFEGTVADYDIFPPGRIDTSCGVTGRIAHPVDPSINEGQEGFAGFAVLSFCKPLFLGVNAEHVVFRVFGRLDTRALREGAAESEPVFVRVAEHLTVFGLPFFSSVTLGEAASAPRTDLVGAAIRLRVSDDPLFRRGDANDDQELTIVDGQFILNFLFLGGREPACVDAADVDDSGDLEMNDAITLFNFLFLGTSVVPAPGPALCGTDATADALSCAAFASCP